MDPRLLHPITVKDPDEWDSALKLTQPVRQFIRAAWSFLDQVLGSAYIHNVHYLWNLRDALKQQDLARTIDAAAQFCEEEMMISDSDHEQELGRGWWAEIAEAFRQAMERVLVAEIPDVRTEWESIFGADVLSPTLVPIEDRSVEVSTIQHSFESWQKSEPEWNDLVPNKPLLTLNGDPYWHEFILLKLLEEAGWAGVWTKNFGGRALWVEPGVIGELPRRAEDVINQLIKSSASKAGAWDIFAWNSGRYLCAESKQTSKDRLRPNQVDWLKAGLKIRADISFVIVEYKLKTSQ